MNPFAMDETLPASRCSVATSLVCVLMSYIPWCHQPLPLQLGPPHATYTSVNHPHSLRNLLIRSKFHLDIFLPRSVTLLDRLSKTFPGH